jgi:hypothetical protein
MCIVSGCQAPGDGVAPRDGRFATANDWVDRQVRLAGCNAGDGVAKPGMEAISSEFGKFLRIDSQSQSGVFGRLVFLDFGEWEQTGIVVDRHEPLGYQQVHLPESRKTAGACQRTNND